MKCDATGGTKLWMGTTWGRSAILALSASGLVNSGLPTEIITSGWTEAKLQARCRRRTRNCGCQLPRETLSTRTRTRSSRPMLPSSSAHRLSRSGAPKSGLGLLPFYMMICVSLRPTLKKHQCRGWSHTHLRLSEPEDGFGDFERQLLSAYRLLDAPRVEHPDLSLPVSDCGGEISRVRTCLPHDAYPGHCQAPSAPVEIKGGEKKYEPRVSSLSSDSYSIRTRGRPCPLDGKTSGGGQRKA